MITVEDLLQLGYYIREEIQEEFRTIHLSGNLAKTVRVEMDDNNNVKVIIPAETYDIAEYRRSKIIKTIPGKSYADSVNKKGGFSKTHVNFIDRCTDKAIQRWLSQKQSKVELESREETTNE